MPFISYTRNQEDVLLWHAFHDIKMGNFLTISSENQASEKSETYCHQVTRSLSERGWSGASLYCGEDALKKFAEEVDSKERLLAKIKNLLRESSRSPFRATTPIDLLVISDVPGLNFAISHLIWEILDPTLILIQANAPASHWQSPLIAKGYELAYQIHTSYFFAPSKADLIFKRFKCPQLSTVFVAEEHLNLKISREDLNLTSKKLQACEKDQHTLRNELTRLETNIIPRLSEEFQATRNELTRLESEITNLIKENYFLPKQPSAMARKIFWWILGKNRVRK